MTILRDLLIHGEAELKRAGVDSPRLSAELMAAQALGLTRMEALLDPGRRLDPDQASRIRELTARRAAGEPAAYIIGEREFYGLDFSVSPDTLIPRPETETLVEAARSAFKASRAFTFLDLGTGSGVLAVTLAHLFPLARGVAVDLSAGALAVARENARRHGVHHRVSFVRADFTRPVVRDASVDLVVANPPYLSEADFGEVSPEVSGFEPRTALVAGPQGDECLNSLVPLAGHALAPDGIMLLEFGWTQGPRVIEIIARTGLFSSAESRRDMAGLERMARAKRQSW
jgi:release factor glutamine methyltransferase